MNRRHIMSTLIATLSGAAISPPAQAKPHPRRVLILQSELAGFQFYRGKDLFAQIQPGQSLKLQREADKDV